MTATISVVTPETAPTLWVVRDRIRFMGTLEGTEWEVLEVLVPDGSGTPPHVHSSPEIFRVLEGTLTFGHFAEGPPRFTTAGSGVVVTVPSRVPHNYENRSGAPARMLVVVERSMADFFRDLGRAETPPAGPPTESELVAIMEACARHGITVLGAPSPR